MVVPSGMRSPPPLRMLVASERRMGMYSVSVVSGMEVRMVLSSRRRVCAPLLCPLSGDPVERRGRRADGGWGGRASEGAAGPEAAGGGGPPGRAGTGPGHARASGPRTDGRRGSARGRAAAPGSRRLRVKPDSGPGPRPKQAAQSGVTREVGGPRHAGKGTRKGGPTLGANWADPCKDPALTPRTKRRVGCDPSVTG